MLQQLIAADTVDIYFSDGKRYDNVKLIKRDKSNIHYMKNKKNRKGKNKLHKYVTGIENIKYIDKYKRC